MYVCLCHGVTSNTIAEVVADGALTCKAVASACEAGTDCARCRRTIQAIIAASANGAGAERD